ncbi:MAG: Hsp70 family protein, partial [Microbacterium sp.]
AEDKQRREAAEVRNQAETLAYSIDKLLTENDDKLPEDVKTEVKADVDALKTALAGDDDEAVKTAFDKLNQSQSKIGEALYASSQAEGAPSAGAEGDAPAGDGSSSEEDVIDAEVVDDEDEKK